MNKRNKTGPLYRTQGSWLWSILFTVPMALILLVMLTGGSGLQNSWTRLVAYFGVWVLNVYLFFRMLYTGKTDRYRAVLFILFALALSFTFIVRMIEARGSMSFDNADILQCKTPFCHIVTTMILIPIAFSKAIIFPGSINGGFASIASMLVLVFGALLVLGRGFCSWGCFYGGWDDGFSRLRKKASWKTPPSYLRWGGFAVLILVALTSAATLIPTYCDWICPFKMVTEFEAVTGVESAMKAAVFSSLFFGLVVALPIATKKRTQCAWFCPMGALCSLSNPVNIHEVRIDKDRCIECGKCVEACPVQALDAEALEKGKPNINCVKCGKCIDVCSRNSIGYHLKFTRILKHPTTSRVLFLYAAFGFLAVFSGGALQQAVVLLINFATTGRVLS